MVRISLRSNKTIKLKSAANTGLAPFGHFAPQDKYY